MMIAALLKTFIGGKLREVVKRLRYKLEKDFLQH